VKKKEREKEFLLQKLLQKEKFPNRQLFLLFSTKERNQKEKVPIQCHK